MLTTIKITINVQNITSSTFASSLRLSLYNLYALKLVPKRQKHKNILNIT